MRSPIVLWGLSLFSLKEAVLLGLTAAAACLTLYLFEAAGTYRLSKNRGFDRPWLAFIPVAGAWVLGGIADSICACYGRRTFRRVWLTAAEAVWLTALAAHVSLFILALPALFSPAYREYYRALANSTDMIAVFSSVVGLLFLGRTAVKAAVLYKIYQDCAPKNAAPLLALSILFGICPFVLFAIRNNASAAARASGTYINSKTEPPAP